MEKDKVKQIPVYILQGKYDSVKRLAGLKRESMTKWIESAIDAKIKKEDK